MIGNEASPHFAYWPDFLPNEIKEPERTSVIGPKKRDWQPREDGETGQWPVATTTTTIIIKKEESRP